jgi:hypothetical protein
LESYCQLEARVPVAAEPLHGLPELFSGGASTDSSWELDEEVFSGEDSLRMVQQAWCSSSRTCSVLKFT